MSNQLIFNEYFESVYIVQKQLYSNMLKVVDYKPISTTTWSFTDKRLTQAVGERGKQLILSSYSSAKVAQMMYQLYSWLLGKQDKPDFVYE